jgi:hypothetical protein
MSSQRRSIRQAAKKKFQTREDRNWSGRAEDSRNFVISAACAALVTWLPRLPTSSKCGPPRLSLTCHCAGGQTVMRCTRAAPPEFIPFPG